MPLLRLVIALFLLAGLGSACRHTTAAAKAGAGLAEPQLSVLTVHITSQRHDFLRPWQKSSSNSRQGLGTLVRPNGILVTANMVDDATFIQLERVGSGEKSTARVRAVDYASNLALLEADDTSILEGLRPLTVRPHSKLGDQFTTWQFEDNGAPFLTTGELRSVDILPYPLDGAYLSYQVEISLARLNNSTGLPVVYGDQLVGLLLTYNAGVRSMNLVPAPIITHFLDDLADGRYDGFPRAGFTFESLTDPQLRAHAGLPEDRDGVFISYLRPGGPAAKTLREGDILLAINGQAVDKLGQYEDPHYGRLNITHLTATAQAGQTQTFTIFRERQVQEVPVTLAVLTGDDYPIAPFVFDQAPRFLILGGLVVQELSRQYLKEWKDWQTNAPPRFLHFDQRQWDLFAPGEKVVILSQILPSPYTLGYEGSSTVRIVSVNDQPATRLEAVKAALAKPVAGTKGGKFHKIVLSEHPFTLYLDAEQLDAANAEIKRRYDLPLLERF